MKEITLTQLYHMWKSYKLEKRIDYFKADIKLDKKKLYTFGEYHTWMIRLGEYKVV